MRSIAIAQPSCHESSRAIGVGKTMSRRRAPLAVAFVESRLRSIGTCSLNPTERGGLRLLRVALAPGIKREAHACELVFQASEALVVTGAASSSAANSNQ